jgi:hypothetical protein
MIAAILPYIIAALTGAAAIVGIWLNGQRRGRLAEKEKASKKKLDDMTKAKAVRDDVDQKSEADVHNALGKWMRDK